MSTTSRSTRPQPASTSPLQIRPSVRSIAWAIATCCRPRIAAGRTPEDRVRGWLSVIAKGPRGPDRFAGGCRGRPEPSRCWTGSPMIRLSGAGSLRTRVGIARIWSPAASFGFTSRSITSIVVAPGQMLLADAFGKIGQCRKRFRRGLAGHVEPQVVALGFRRSRPDSSDSLVGEPGHDRCMSASASCSRLAGDRLRSAPLSVVSCVSSWSSSRLDLLLLGVDQRRARSAICRSIAERRRARSRRRRSISWRRRDLPFAARACVLDQRARCRSARLRARHRVRSARCRCR